MRVGGSLYLAHLDERLVADPLLRVVVVHRISGPVDQLEHLTVGAVRVVRDGETLDALRAQLVHPVPQTFGILRVEARERDGGQALTVLEDDVAVQVAAIVGRRSVFVGDEGGEMAGVVELLGGVDDVAPRGLGDPGSLFAIDGAVAEACDGLGDEVGESLQPPSDTSEAHVAGAIEVAHRCRGGELGELGGDVAGLGREAEEHRMVGDRIEVERFAQLNVESRRMADRLSPGVAVGVVGRRSRPERIGIERVGRVNVKVAEVGVPLRVPPRPELDELVFDREGLLRKAPAVGAFEGGESVFVGVRARPAAPGHEDGEAKAGEARERVASQGRRFQGSLPSVEALGQGAPARL